MLNISPGWLHVMRIPLLSGRDFHPEDVYPGAAIVNQAFAREYFDGRDPVGRRFEVVSEHDRVGFEVMGLCGDAARRNVREPMPPQAYFPLRSVDASGQLLAYSEALILVRTLASDPNPMAAALRHEVPTGRAEFRVSDLTTQVDINQAQTLRERVLSMLSLFFATVALLLAGVGLYGVLNHSVVQRRREIGTRMAIGAQASNVARLVTSRMVAGGARRRHDRTYSRPFMRRTFTSSAVSGAGYRGHDAPASLRSDCGGCSLGDGPGSITCRAHRPTDNAPRRVKTA